MVVALILLVVEIWIMAQRQRVTKTRVKRNGSSNSGGYMQCNICRGTGVVKKPTRKKK